MFNDDEDYGFLTGGLGDLNGDGDVDFVEYANGKPMKFVYEERLEYIPFCFIFLPFYQKKLLRYNLSSYV